MESEVLEVLKGGNCNIRYARAMVVTGLFNDNHMIFIINNIHFEQLQ